MLCVLKSIAARLVKAPRPQAADVGEIQDADGNGMFDGDELQDADGNDVFRSILSTVANNRWMFLVSF